MGIEATGAEVRKGPGIRFGIRWDDGGRPNRAVLALALALALLAVPASAAHADGGGDDRDAVVPQLLGNDQLKALLVEGPAVAGPA